MECSHQGAILYNMISMSQTTVMQQEQRTSDKDIIHWCVCICWFGACDAWWSCTKFTCMEEKIKSCHEAKTRSIRQMYAQICACAYSGLVHVMQDRLVQNIYST